MTKSNRAKKVRAAPTMSSVTQVTVSNWSNPNTPPTKVGVYEIKPEYGTGHRMYAYWSGRDWCEESQTIEGANEHAAIARVNQQVTWRGIVK